MPTPCLDCGITCRGPRCPIHQRQHKAKYGGEHQALRKQWAPIVALGHTPCSRCGQPIIGPFDMDHIDGRDIPAHPRCNRGAR